MKCSLLHLAIQSGWNSMKNNPINVERMYLNNVQFEYNPCSITFQQFESVKVFHAWHNKYSTMLFSTTYFIVTPTLVEKVTIEKEGVL